MDEDDYADAYAAMDEMDEEAAQAQTQLYADEPPPPPGQPDAGGDADGDARMDDAAPGSPARARLSWMRSTSSAADAAMDAEPSDAGPGDALDAAARDAAAAAEYDAEADEADKENAPDAWRDTDDFGQQSDEAKARLAVEKRRLQANSGATAQRAQAAAAPPLGHALLDRPPLDDESVPVTLADGSRFHCRVAREAADGPRPGREATLLARDVDALRAEIAAADAAAALEEEDEGGGGAAVAPRGDGSLWVDRYAPASFAHLLSDERCNRDVLRALKDWDPYVFKKPAPAPARAPVYRPPPKAGGGFSLHSGARGGTFSSSGGRRFEPKRLNAPGRDREKKGGPPPPPRRPLPAAGGGGGGRGFSGGRGGGRFGGRGRGFGGSDEPLKTRGDDGRPLKRVILLAGEPGTGKTTLAHVLARQAGYAVREVNASDERSAEAIATAVRIASGNRTLRTAADDRADAADAAKAKRRSSVGGKAPPPGEKAKGGLCERPTLLVLDELDGADGKAAVAALVAMAKADLPSKTKKKKGPSIGGLGGDEPEEKAAPGPKGRKGPPPLQRPVICVCNDAYAPALRQLRDVALVYHFRAPPTAQRLTARLRVVAAAEGVAAAPAALARLAEAADGDVRAALVALQFAAVAAGDRTSTAKVGAALENAVESAVKDRAADELELLARLFRRPGDRKLNAKPKAPVLAELARADAARVADGVLENYGRCDRKGPNGLEACAALLDDLSSSDVFVGAAFKRETFAALPYASAVGGLAARARYAVDAPPRMQRPTASTQLRRDREKVEADLRAVDDARAAQGQKRLGVIAEALDQATTLRRLILAPGAVRPVNPDLLRAPEKAALAAAAGRLGAHGLTFERDRTLEPTAPGPKWKLRPDVSAASRFGDVGEEPLPDALRQVLARRVLLERVRKREAEAAERRAAAEAAAPTKAPEPAAPSPEKDVAEKVASARTPAAPAKRGFSFASWGTGRRRAPPPKKRKAAAAAPAPASAFGRPRKKPAVTFKFKKGFTNAVRREVTLEDLLG